MTTDELQKTLSWFHALEVNQVSLYKAQAALAHSDVDRRMLLKVADIEQGHVVNTLRALRDLGGSPSALSVVAPITGVGLGAVTGMTLEMALRSDIAIENKAMSDYQEAIAKCDNDAVLEVLWGNYLDESLHTEWFKSRLAQNVDKVTEAEAIGALPSGAQSSSSERAH